MYQDQCDMMEEEYLRQRIRNILQQQVAQRGYGANWNSTLGAREIRGPIDNQATIYQNLLLNEGENEANKGGVAVGGVPVGGVDVGGVAVGGALNSYTLKQLRLLVRNENKSLQQKNRIKNYTKLSKKQLLKKLRAVNFRVKTMEAKDRQAKKKVAKKGKKQSAYNMFVGKMIKQGNTFKEAVNMWNAQKAKGKGGQLPPGYIQAGQCEMKSDWEQFLKCEEQQGGYYLR